VLEQHSLGLIASNAAAFTNRRTPILSPTRKLIYTIAYYSCLVA